MTRQYLIIFSWVSFFQLPGFSQSIQADTVFLAQATQNEIALYSKAMVAQSHLYNGTEYGEYRPLKEENPFFLSVSDWTDGSIYYDGWLYQNTPLLYDISTDKVIAEHYSSRKKIQLIDDKVEWFALQTHRFVHLRDERLPKGFYELLHDGITKVYVKRIKSYQQEISGLEIIRTFDEKSLFYIFKQNNFYLVKNKKTVMAVFRDRKSELNQFISKNHIRFKSNREKSISTLAEFYDRINK